MSVLSAMPSLISTSQIEALAAITLVLGIVYWLMHERDDRLRGVDDN